MNEEKMTLGAYLRQEREKKNISLEAISRATKINLKNLQIIERDEFHLLPPPVFIRGFLRAYALYIGLDPQKVSEMYELQTKAADLSPRITKSVQVKKISHLTKIIAISFLVILIIILLFTFSNSPPPPPPEIKGYPLSPPTKVKAPPAEALLPQTSPAEEKKEEAPPLPPPTTITPEKATVLPLGDKKKERRHVLKVKATERTWLRLKADDEKEVEALLQPKEVATWTARRQFKIIIGNAGGVEISLNGIPQGRLGESGQVVHLLLPAEIKKKEEFEKKD